MIAVLGSRHHRLEGVGRHHGSVHTTTGSNGTTAAHLSSVERKSEKECGEHNQRSKSFLLLPCLILGGSAVECRLLHDDTVVDNNKYIVFCFVRSFDFRQNRFYVMIVCLHNNKTTQLKIAETIHIIIRKIKVVNLPSSYNKYLQYLYDLPISTSI